MKPGFPFFPANMEIKGKKAAVNREPKTGQILKNSGFYRIWFEF
jgi:hypothetical protein